MSPKCLKSVFISIVYPLGGLRLIQKALYLIYLPNKSPKLNDHIQYLDQYFKLCTDHRWSHQNTSK